MSDNNSDKQPAAPTPKKPPKTPSRDYSALPQKPITLKSKAKKPAPPTRQPVKAKPRTKPKRVSGKSPAPAQKKQPAPWNIEGISNEAKQVIQEAATAQGLTVSQWLEQLILNQENNTQTKTVAADEQLLRSLQAIEKRLERIEQHRGFWSRFWDQVMNQP